MWFKGIIMKVVTYLAKNPDKEARLVNEQGGNEKMAFLLPSSPYFAFYKQSLVQEKLKGEASVDSSQQTADTSAEKEEKKEVEKPADFNWILPTNPLSIPTYDFELISLVAQYVAKSGRGFQMGVWNRESRNPQYGFLAPHHPLHELYQHLVADYTRIIVKNAATLESHAVGASTSRQSILERITKRKDWKVSEKEKEEAENGEEQLAVNVASAIDWNDAIIVDTITFNPAEDHLLPAPIEQGKLLSVYLATKQKEEEAKQRSVESHANSSAPNASAPGQHVPSGFPSSNISASEPQTAADIQRSASSGPKKMTAICPICRMAFPVDEIDGHMKVEMSKGGNVGMSSNRPQSKPEFAPVVATGDDIAARLSKFAKRRTDLFDDEAGERAAEAKRQEQERREREAAAAAAAVSHSYNRPNLDNFQHDAYAPSSSTYHQSSGHSSAPGSYPPNMGDFHSGKRAATDALPEDAPMAKKSKVIELLTEKEFAEQNPNPISITVSMEDEGTSFEITMPIMTSVKSLKDSLAEKTSIPVNKQILKVEHLGFLKDKLTLAHYNLVAGTIISLSTKERGGKKK